MNAVMKNAIVDESASELTALLSEHMDTIDQAMQSSLADHDGEKEFSYTVRLALKITPYAPGQARVAAKIAYSVNHTDETDGRMVEPDQAKFEFAQTGPRSFEAKVK